MSDVNHVVSMLERCAANIIEWASRRGLQFDTAKTDGALFTHRRGSTKYLRAKMTAKLTVGNKSLRFIPQATRWLGVWVDAHLTFMEHHNQCTKKARAGEARIWSLPKTYDVVPESVMTVQVPCVQAVAIYGSELWCDPREVGRRHDLQLLLNRQARFILGTLPKTPQGAQKRESGLTPVPVILDSTQQQFAARIENPCSSKLNKLHKDPSSGAPIRRAVRKDHEHGRTTEGINWRDKSLGRKKTAQ